MNRLVLAGITAAIVLASLALRTAGDTAAVGSGKIEHVLLLSIDGMQWISRDCAHGSCGRDRPESTLPEHASSEPGMPSTM